MAPRESQKPGAGAGFDVYRWQFGELGVQCAASLEYCPPASACSERVFTLSRALVRRGVVRCKVHV